MSARYWVGKALKKAAKDPDRAGDILAECFQEALDHQLEEYEGTYKPLAQERDRLYAGMKRIQESAHKNCAENGCSYICLTAKKAMGTP